MRPDTMKRNRTGDKGKTLEKNNSKEENVGLLDVIALILRSSKAASFPSFFVIMFF